MLVSYGKLEKLLNRKGESFNSLFEKGILTDYARRQLKNGKYVDIKYLAKICIYFDVPIEDIVEVIHKPID